MKKLCCLLLSVGLCIAGQVMATPSTIMVIRHGDKLDQTAAGSGLSAVGYARAVKFLSYFKTNMLDTHVILPANVFLVAFNPKGECSKTTSKCTIDPGHSSSDRALETLSPLEDYLQAQDSNNNHAIIDPYGSEDYKKLAHVVLNDPTFDGKFVVICWEHKAIPALLQDLGVTLPVNEKGPQWKWPDDNFDGVYLLQFDSKGLLVSAVFTEHEYPVNLHLTWDQINASL